MATNIGIKRTIQAVIADVSTGETVLVYVPYTGVVTAVHTLLEGTLTNADAAVTLVQSDDSAMAAITVAYDGSAAGDITSDTEISNADVTAGTYLKLVTDGGSTGTQSLWVTIEVVETA